MSFIANAMAAASVRTRVRSAVEKLINDLSVEDQITILAEVLHKIEQTSGLPTEEPAAGAAPERRDLPPAAAKEAEKSPPRPFARRPEPTGAGAPRKSMAGRMASKILPGMTTHEAAEAILAIVKETPGIGANEIADKLGTKRERLTKTMRLAKSLGLVRTEGAKNGTKYFPAAAKG